MRRTTTVAERAMALKYMKLPKLVLVFLGVNFPLWSFGQEDLGVLSYWKMYDQEPHQFYSHLMGIADGQLKNRAKAIAKLETAKDWENRRLEVQKKLAIAFGKFPAKTPLNAVVTDIIERGGIRVEKLYFESQPGYFVTAALFLPTNRQKKLPAIVYCSGHSENGFRAEAYQRIMLNYVKKGFAVLAFDPIGQGERRQYLSENGKSRFGPTQDHSYSGSPTFISGIAPANYFIWDGVRAIDYLVSRPEIDANRIGIAGRSGGGTQSAFIAAMDERVLAAAPECYVTSFDKLLRSKGPQDAEQNPMYALALGLDIADLLEVRMPKPALLVTTTEDIFSIQGARDVFAEVSKAYQLAGKKGNLTKTEDEGGHISTRKNREASYAFFQKFLNNPGDSTDLEVAPFSEKELLVTATGNVFSSLGGQNLFSLNRYYTADLLKNKNGLQLTSSESQKAFQSKVAEVIGYQNPGAAKEVVFSGRIRRAGYTIEKYFVQRSEGSVIPMLWMKPENGKNKVVLLLNDRGKKEAAIVGGEAEKLVLEGYDVVLPDLSGFGELSNSHFKGGDAVIDNVPLNLWYMGILVNKSLVAVHVEEIKLIQDFIKAQRPNAAVSAVGIGVLTSDLLHASVLLNSLKKTALIAPLISYQSITEQENYEPKYLMSAVVGVLPNYDLPDLAEAMTRPVLLIGAVDASGKATDKSHVEQVYQRSILGNKLEIADLAPGESYFNSLSNWLKE